MKKFACGSGLWPVVFAVIFVSASCTFAVKDRRFLQEAHWRSTVGYPQPLPGLDYTFYDDTCPQAEGIIRSRVNYFVEKNVSNAARLLRLFYQDCFVKGCDASVLLKGSAYGPWDNSASPEKALAVEAFEIIDDIKGNLEKECPQAVSCADIVALAARDAVLATEGPYFPMPSGRRDGRDFDTTLKTEQSMPKSTWNVSLLLKSFKSRGLNVMDLVALSGSHTIGKAHCASLSDRLCPLDPLMNKKLVKKLLNVCHSPTSSNSTDLDLKSPDEFDNKYYKNLMKNKGLLTSDQALYYDARTREIVRTFRETKDFFFMQFAESAIKMSQIGVLIGTQGEIRLNCSVPNYIPPPPLPPLSPSPAPDTSPPSVSPSHSPDIVPLPPFSLGGERSSSAEAGSWLTEEEDRINLVSDVEGRSQSY